MSQVAADFSQLNTQMAADPYGENRKLRGEGAVLRVRHASLKRDVYLVSTYALCKEVFDSPARFSSALAQPLFFAGAEPNPEAADLLNSGPWDGSVLILMDGPTHARARALTTAALTPERLRQVTESLDRIVNSLIDEFGARGRCNFIDEFAAPFTLEIITSFFNADKSLTPKFRDWAEAFNLRLSQWHSKEEELNAVKSVLELEHYILEMIAERRRNPGDDLLSAIIQARVPGHEPLADREIVRSMIELIAGGTESTRSAITGGMVALIQNPEQMEALIADPSLMTNAVEEIVRYYSPTRTLWRVAVDDTELGGIPIPKHAAVLIRVEAANRDEEMFLNANTFNIRRKGVRNHIAFGFGLHTCVGNFLARKEIAVALRLLLSRLTNLRIDHDRSDLTFMPNLLMRRFKAVHLTFDA